RQAADVVVRLDDVRLARARAGRLDHVGVDGALGEELDSLELVRLLVEHFDKRAADDLALLFRIGNAGEGLKKPRLGIDADDAYAEVLRESAHHLVALAQAQQAVIDEHARELPSNGTVEQGGYHGGVDTARQAQ